MRLIPFSIFFWIFSFAWMGVLFVISALLLPFMRYEKFHTKVIGPGFGILARMITLGEFRITYDPKFDPTRKSVFCQNHVNILDAYTASATIPHSFCGLMDAWQFHIPIYGWIMKLSRGIPVDRKNKKRLIQEMSKEATARREENLSILVFPEGHRTRDGKVGKFRRGVFYMARDAGYPIVPIAVRGMYAINQRKSYLFKPGPVSVYVGPQIETQGLSDEELDALVERTRESIIRYTEYVPEKLEELVA